MTCMASVGMLLPAMLTKIVRGSVFTLGLVMGLAVAAAAQGTIRPSDDQDITEVRLQVGLLDLERIQSAEQSFTANLFYAARWRDEGLRHEGPGPKTLSLDEIWHPRLQLVNQQRLVKTFGDVATVTPDGQVTVAQRVWGQFSQPLQLREFPFDVQTLHVEIVGSGHDEGTVTFLPDPDHPSVVSDALSITDWEIGGWSARPSEFLIAGITRSVPSFRLELTLARIHGYHLVQVILPLLMIIFMSWIVFWINPKNTNPRISVSVTAMLTLIAYRFAVGRSLPPIGYLTRLDWFILGASLLVFAALVEVIVTVFLCESGREKTALRINRWMRVIGPVALAGIVVEALVL